MHSRIRMKGILLAALVAVLASVALPGAASAEPQPGAKKKGFRLFARALGAMTVNRIYCGLASDGRVCVDSTNSSTIGGGFWPKGTADQYVFNSGLQVAGIIGTDGGVWAGDTVGGFFFDPKGTTEHGEEVQPLYNATGLDANGRDVAGSQWPEAACVPSGTDADATLFSSLLQTGTDSVIAPGCRISASQGDVWFMSWEGNPSLKAGRAHPLGVAVETRGLGWNYPKGNEDILYFIYSFYNITSKNRADYNAIRPALADILYQKALDFHAQNLAQGVDLPDGGYTIENMFAAFSADMDVAEAGSNYSGVNLPFALGHTYDHTFSKPTGWTFDPSIFSPPFFSGAGFVGVKYLKSPTGAGAINLFGNTVNGGLFGDARDVVQLYRYLSGSLSPAAGDQACNTGDPTVTHICWVNNGSPADMRFFQSSTSLTLAPGGRGSIVVAYIFAAPVVTGTCPGPLCDLRPGDGRLLTDAALLPTTGANQVDSVSGYLGFSDLNSDNIVQQGEMTVVGGSLLGKALVAQAVFDGKFLLPFAPNAPEFFLVPGDNEVTVLWKPSSSEATGDPYFATANAATVFNPNTSAFEPNALYDPNYRQFDVEGYRVYRGRVDAPNELTLLAQYDYTGTVISDFTGIVNPQVTCAPEYSIDVGGACPVSFPAGGNLKDGTTLTVHEDYELVGDVIQLNAGSGRIPLADGTAYTVKADTAVVGGGTNGACGPKSSCPALDDTGVPFVYVDQTPRNNFRYFYAVTAFDINSVESGPTSLESPRNTKSVTPVRKASNYAGSGQITSTEIVGRGVVLTDNVMPTINPVTGTFSKQFPPSNAWNIGLGAFVSKVLAQPGALSATLDSINMGSAYSGVPHEYWFTVAAPGQSFVMMIPLEQPDEVGVTSGAVSFQAVPIDNSLASRYGGNNSYYLPGSLGMAVNGPDYLGLYGRGCVNGRAGFTAGSGCSYNGSRWFDGPSPTTNETVADPIGCNTANFSGAIMTCFNNAGGLTGVTTIFQAQCYQAAPGGGCRQSTGIWSGVRRAADFNVYWGNGGTIDSVIDVTHNVVVPGPADGYANKVSATWGILNTSATTGTQPDGRAEGTMKDFGCVEPMRTLAQGSFTCPGANTDYVLSNTAIPGAVAFFSGGAYPTATSTNVVVAANAGFNMYIVGDIFTFELTGGAVPAAGTVWSMRSYAGAITGGNGSGGNEGSYAFANPEGLANSTDGLGLRPFTSIGSVIQTTFDVDNSINAVTASNLKQVHTVPDPYYVTNGYEQTTDNKVIKFVNLPRKAIIRIYSSSGVLVNILEHNSTTFGGELTWNVRNRNNQVVASGVYFYHIESNDGTTARRVGRMTIVNFAQ